MKMVFDSSSIISISQTCLLDIIGGLVEKAGVQFFIPEAVFNESVKRPLEIKRFELNAVRIKKAIDAGWFQVRNVSDRQLFSEIDRLSNNSFFLKGKPIRLLQKGEIESLVLIKELGADAFATDERTARTIVENPKMLQKILSMRRRKHIGINSDNIQALKEMFSDITIVRSVELIALSYEHGLLGEMLPEGKQSLEAALFAAKYGGCAVSAREINIFLHRKE